MTKNYTIQANGQATVDGSFLKVRIGLDQTNGNRYFYIPEIRSRGQEYKRLGNCPNSLWVDHDQLIKRMIELSA